jgi:hypothetical protein
MKEVDQLQNSGELQKEMEEHRKVHSFSLFYLELPNKSPFSFLFFQIDEKEGIIPDDNPILTHLPHMMKQLIPGSPQEQEKNLDETDSHQTPQTTQTPPIPPIPQPPKVQQPKENENEDRLEKETRRIV